MKWDDKRMPRANACTPREGCGCVLLHTNTSFICVRFCGPALQAVASRAVLRVLWGFLKFIFCFFFECLCIRASQAVNGAQHRRADRRR